MKHGESPQVLREVRHVPKRHIHCRVQVDAPVMRNDALRTPCRPAGVAKSDGVPLISGKLPLIVWITLRQEFLVLNGLAHAHAHHQLIGQSALAVLDIDAEHIVLYLRQRVSCKRGELGVANHSLRLSMADDVGDGLGIEPRVDGVQNCPGHRNAEVALVHLGCVRTDDRDSVSLSNAPLIERGCERPASLSRLLPGEALVVVDHRSDVWVDLRRSGQVAQRAQLCVVGLQLRKVPTACGEAAHKEPPASESTLAERLGHPDHPPFSRRPSPVVFGCSRCASSQPR
mmetsp:Transcript_27537/g.68001  ORF Transcript_27537/g.68001 Transcript_27537/m.68001 type:complete len:286 (-) Transcript_27537:131-988(-)